MSAKAEPLKYQRILIIGSGGSGKSTLSCQLAEKTKLPLIHLDHEYWKPGWVETPKEEWRGRVAELAEQEQWIMDGNFSGSLDIRVPRCDCIVLLDYSRITCAFGVIKRWITNFGKTRPDMGKGCPEKVDFHFLKWVWGFPKSSLPKIMKCLDSFPDKPLLILKSRRDAQRWLETWNTSGF